MGEILGVVLTLLYGLLDFVTWVVISALDAPTRRRLRRLTSRRDSIRPADRKPSGAIGR